MPRSIFGTYVNRMKYKHWQVIRFVEATDLGMLHSIFKTGKQKRVQTSI